MTIPPEKLAQSLEILRNLQTAEGAGAIRARDLSRTHRERLLRNGFLQEVIKGWYIPSRPDEVKGDSTAWYASFWRFCAAYLEARFGARPDRHSPFRGLEFPQDFEGLREFLRGYGHSGFPSGFVFLLSDCVALYLYYCAVRLLSYYVVPFLSYCVETGPSPNWKCGLAARCG